MYHNLSLKECFKRFNSTKSGISADEADLRLKKYDLNKLPEFRVNPVVQFLKQFQNPLIIILIIAGAISFSLKRIADGSVILIAVLIAVILSFWQEFKAAKVSKSLKQRLKKFSIVIRDSKELLIDTERLVPGDILVLKAGDSIGADARLIENFHLKINEAVLTGESMAVDKTLGILPLDTSLPDRKNMVFAGTVVEEGSGKAMVTATGLNTEFGKIASELASIKDERSPLQKNISKLAKLLGIIIIGLTIALILVGLYRNFNLFDIFLTGVAVAVAAIPEGLPAATSVVLAIGMSRTLKKQGLIKKVSAVETLGRTSIILTDKTGTLTRGEMSVSKITNSNDHLFLLKIAALTSEAFIENPRAPFGNWIAIGRPTEKAMVLAAAQAGLHKEELLKKEPRIDFLPFNPERKYTASLHPVKEPIHGFESATKDKNIIYFVGAPEILLEMSNRIYQNKNIKDISEKTKKEMENKIREIAAEGERVIAVGFKKTKLNTLKNHNLDDFKNIIFGGLISFNDPLREDVVQAIKTTNKAGLKTVVITGDLLLTAKKAAENLGLTINEKEILNGKDLEKIDDAELEKIVSGIKLYYRTAPSQKLRIVRAWQKKNEIVVMIGDGVNDAPAIKQADIGVAVGSGTDVAKEVSDLILINNSFSTIVSTIKESRIIIDNIRKTLTFLLSTTFTEVVLVGLSFLAGLPLPILPGQILWANLVQGGPMSFSLAFEPGEKGLMKKERIRSDRSIFTQEMKFLIFIVGIATDLILFALFFFLLKFKISFEHLRTIMFLGLSLDTIFFLWPLKSMKRPIWKINIFNNLYLIAASAVSIFLLIGAVTLPHFQRLLHTVRPTPFEWLIVVGLGILNLALIELGKSFFIKDNSHDNK